MWRFDQHADDAQTFFSAANRVSDHEARLEALLMASTKATLAVFELQRAAHTQNGWVHPRRPGDQ